MFFKNPLDKKFAQWARGKKVLPLNASVMKEKFLSSVKNSDFVEVKKIRPVMFKKLVLSFGLAVLVLLVAGDMTRVILFRGKMAEEYGITQIGGVSRGGGYGVTMSAPIAANRDGYNESFDALGLQPGKATGLGSKDIRAQSLIGMAADKATSFVKEFVQPEYQQNRYFATSNSINDTREFSKFTYNSALKTRDVEDVSTRILTTIRGYGGRVDDASIQEKYSYINFVVPKDNLLQFKTEIKGMVGKRFYVESLHIQNLLPEKVAIEESTEVVNKNLIDLQDKLKEFTEKHGKTIAGLQRDLGSVNGRIAKLNAEVTSDPERQKQIKVEIAALAARQGVLQRQIISENNRYNFDKASMEQYIKSTQAKLDNLDTQEKNLLDNVETVQGYVAVQWISVWQMINIYIPHLWAWVVGAIVLLLIFNYFSKRRTIQAW